ncbi:hypothetical protein L1887_03198 [Cichorium endivia]|nr:hypothetical protein L1887_03198 [Cichorium endivia]
MSSSSRHSGNNRLNMDESMDARCDCGNDDKGAYIMELREPSKEILELQKFTVALEELREKGEASIQTTVDGPQDSKYSPQESENGPQESDYGPHESEYVVEG